MFRRGKDTYMGSVRGYSVLPFPAFPLQLIQRRRLKSGSSCSGGLRHGHRQKIEPKRLRQIKMTVWFQQGEVKGINDEAQDLTRFVFVAVARCRLPIRKVTARHRAWTGFKSCHDI